MVSGFYFYPFAAIRVLSDEDIRVKGFRAAVLCTLDADILI